jgi:hypothetical protein
VDQVGEPGFCIFVLGFYVQDLLGGFGGGLAGRASAQLHLQGAGDCHGGRACHAREQAFAEIGGYVSEAHEILLLVGCDALLLIKGVCPG